MSVPVRYSAAANYAVADSGLNNQQEEQYHQYSEEDLYNHHFNSHLNHNIIYGYSSVLEEQQQLMQQNTSMSVTVKPQDLVAVGADTMATSNAYRMDQEQATTSAKARELLLVGSSEGSTSSSSLSLHHDMPSTSAMAAAAAAESANTAANNGSSHTAEMRTEWMRMSDEGRYGTPGAAGLDYQKFELEQQQQQQTPNANQHMDQTMEPSLTDNEKKNLTNNNLEDELISLTSEELYNTLKEYDALQDKYHTVLLLPKESRVSSCFVLTFKIEERCLRKMLANFIIPSL